MAGEKDIDLVESAGTLYQWRVSVLAMRVVACYVAQLSSRLPPPWEPG